MRRVLGCGSPLAIIALLVTSRGFAATLSAVAVAVNDQPIEPTGHVVIAPGDSVTCEFYLVDWNDDLPGGRLGGYQVGIDGVTSYHSGTRGRLEPIGWDVVWPALCDDLTSCPAETPVCDASFGTCGCNEADNACPLDHATCDRRLCVGTSHDGALATFIDVERPDFPYIGLQPFIAVRSDDADLRTIWGAVPLTGEGPLDSGQSLYVGTHVMRATGDACGTFTLAVELNHRDTFVIFGPLEIFYPSYVPLTIEVNTGTSCTPLTTLQSFTPSPPSSLVRIRLNSIGLVFDGPITAPTAGQITIMELTEGVCAGSSGPDLSDQFEFTLIDIPEAPPQLRIVDPVASTLQHARWYRIENTGGWPGVAPFHVDIPVIIGDASGDGVVTFADLGAINVSVPTGPGGINNTNRHRDINADGVITFADIGLAWYYNPTPSVPHPCP